RARDMQDPVARGARTAAPADDRQRPRPTRQENERRAPRRSQWAEFIAALPSAETLIPRLGLHHGIFAVASVMVLAAAAGGAIVHRNPAGVLDEVVPPSQPEPARSPSPGTARVAPP